MDRQPISREGFDKLREELRHLEEVDALAAALRKARRKFRLPDSV